MNEMQRMKKVGIGCGIMFVVIALVAWIGLIAMSMDIGLGDAAWLIFTIAIFPTVGAVILFLMGFNSKKEYESLKIKYDKMMSGK